MSATVKITVVIVSIVLFVLFYLKIIMNTTGKDGFIDIPGIAEGQQRFNDFMNLINIPNPQIPFTHTTQTKVDQALATPEYSGGLPGQFQQSGVSAPYKIPTRMPDTLHTAQTICETIKSPNCGAFQNTEFAQNCGISFDMNGLNSKGEGHIGGLYISQDDRTSQLQQAHRLGVSPNEIRYIPSIGKAKKGMYSVDSGSCTVLSEQLSCKRNHVIGDKNCTQCFTSSEFNRTDPNTPRIKPTFVVASNASIINWTFKNNTEVIPNNPDGVTPTTFSIDDLNEGEMFYINVLGDPATVYLTGYLTGTTARGAFVIDLKSLVKTDIQTNYMPRLAGTKTINNTRCFVMRPGMGTWIMQLQLFMPYTFLSTIEYDAKNCDNGPIITQQASATFLESDVCYGPTNKPGTYSLGCLQQLFIGMGGTTQGTGYPSNPTSAKVILFDNNTPRTLPDIGNYIYDMSVRASTGKSQTGASLSIPDWNTASMFCTGTPITSPCDGSNTQSGPLTPDCLQYLYTNGGAAKNDGATYSLGQRYASKDNANNNVYCRPEGNLSPTNPNGLARAQAAGGVASVKALYANAHKTANDNTLTNDQRTAAIKDCYGDSLQQSDPEVYWVGPGYQFTQAQAPSTCQQYGGRVATSAEVLQAQSGGADWCATGWVSDSNIPQYPITTSIQGGCGNGSPGIKQYLPGNVAGVNCYGPKPSKTNVQGKILPFNASVWNAASQ